jgi:Domain of Unknown Function (DUF326)
MDSIVMIHSRFYQAAFCHSHFNLNMSEKKGITLFRIPVRIQTMKFKYEINRLKKGNRTNKRRNYLMSREKYQTLVKALHHCMEACNHCYDSCLGEDDLKMMAGCIRLDRECSDICGFLEQALLRGTPFASELASVCAAICEACGNECKKHDHHHCQVCADACFECAEECKKIA